MAKQKPDLAEPAAEERLAGFLAKFTPEIAAFAQASLFRMRARLPGAMELVYDNYNALAIGFGPRSARLMRFSPSRSFPGG